MTAVLDLSQTSPPVSDAADQGDTMLAAWLHGITASGTSPGIRRWSRASRLHILIATTTTSTGVTSALPLASVTGGTAESTSTAAGEFVDAEAVAITRGRVEPIWAAAARAVAEGRLGPPPRMPTVRPDSDYETDPAEAAAFAEPEYRSRRRGYR
jgi:hypothetical protein